MSTVQNGESLECVGSNGQVLNNLKYLQDSYTVYQPCLFFVCLD